MENALQKRCNYDFMVPDSYDRAVELSQAYAKSGMVPAYYQNNATDILIAWSYGSPLGLSPLMALNGICVINRRPHIWGEVFWGVILSHPQVESIEEEWNKAEEEWVVKILRRGYSKPFIGTFSMKDAGKAGLLEDSSKRHTWGKYPKDMCLWRARSRAGRAACADLLCGLSVADKGEIIDITPKPGPSRVEINLDDIKPAQEEEDDKTQAEQSTDKGESEEAVAPKETTLKVEPTEDSPSQDFEGIRTKAKQVYDSLSKESRIAAIAEFTGKDGMVKISVAKITDARIEEFSEIVAKFKEMDNSTPQQRGEEETLSQEHVDNIRKKVKDAWLAIESQDIKNELKEHLNADIIQTGRPSLNIIVVARMDVPTLLMFYKVLKEQGIYEGK